MIDPVPTAAFVVHPCVTCGRTPAGTLTFPPMCCGTVLQFTQIRTVPRPTIPKPMGDPTQCPECNTPGATPEEGGVLQRLAIVYTCGNCQYRFFELRGADDT